MTGGAVRGLLRREGGKSPKGPSEEGRLEEQ